MVRDVPATVSDTRAGDFLERMAVAGQIHVYRTAGRRHTFVTVSDTGRNAVTRYAVRSRPTEPRPAPAYRGFAGRSHVASRVGDSGRSVRALSAGVDHPHAAGARADRDADRGAMEPGRNRPALRHADARWRPHGRDARRQTAHAEPWQEPIAVGRVLSDLAHWRVQKTPPYFLFSSSSMIA